MLILHEYIPIQSYASRQTSRKVLAMADPNEIHPLNAPGEFFNDSSCIDCGLCPESAPQLFRRDDENGLSYLYRQPQNEEERALACEALEDCPTESIGRKKPLSAPN